MFKKFFLLFALLIMGLYYVPILYSEREIVSEPITTNPNYATSMNADDTVYPLPVSGFEHYVGQPVQAYVDRHGDPDKVYSDEAEGKSWWTYHLDLSEFIQLEIQDEVIQSLFVLGSDIQTGAIQIGMNRQNVYDETALGNHFDFKAHGQQYSLTLKREEWEYFPLVQFDNNSFAVLYFHPETHEIYGIRYLSPETLLGLNYYEIAGNDSTSKRVIANESNHLMEHYINAVRNEFETASLVKSEALSIYGQELLKEEGLNSLTFKGLSEETKLRVENEGKTVEFLIGDEIIDPAMRFGLLFLDETNRRLLLNSRFTAFSITKINDDLVLVFESGKVGSDDY